MTTLTNLYLIAHETVRSARRRRHLPVMLLAVLASAGICCSMEFFGSVHYQQFFFHIMMLVLPLVTVVVATLTTCWVLPQQRQDHTLHLILARPVARWQVIIGTFLGVAVTSVMAFFVFTAIFLLSLWWRAVVFPPALLHAVTLLLVQVLLFNALALLLSLLTTPAMTAVVCLLYYFLGQLIQPTLQPVLAGTPWLVRLPAWCAFFATPHLNYFNLTMPVVHQWPAVSWFMLVPTITYGVGWTALLLLAACGLFRRCDV
ncbi:MAG: ABC transporter permease subunit [bacterium]|nr:ABC transporter permease subunit [bacterium]